MSQDVVEFVWQVNQAGYDVVFGKPMDSSHSAHYLVARQMTDGSGMLVTMGDTVRDHSGAFRDFAETPLTPKGLISFANRHGLLGVEKLRFVVTDLRPDLEPSFIDYEDHGHKQSVVFGEAVTSWVPEIMRMRMAVRLWDFWKTGNVDELRKRIVWLDEDTIVYSPDVDSENVDAALIDDHGFMPIPITGPLFSRGRDDELMQRFTYGDVLRPTIYYVQRVINEHLSKRLSAKLLWKAPKHVALGLFVQPVNLAGALWLQFARAVEGGKDFRSCDTCAAWFEVGTGKARSDQRYCSANCRVRGHRDKQAKARALHVEGLSVEKIATELDAKPDAVSKWVTKPVRLTK